MPKFATYRYEDNSKSYTMTNEDLVWLAKALWGEAGSGSQLSRDEASALAWTMFLRFFRWGTKWKSFKSLIRGFSQPTNPAWLDPQGAKCQKYPQYCTAAHIKRRQQIQGASWDQIPQSARTYATMFAEGTLEPVLSQDYIDFATTASAKKKGYEYEGHWFIRDDQTTIKWTDKKVVVVRDPDAPDIDPDETPMWLKLGIGAWLLATAVAAWKLFFGGK